MRGKRLHARDWQAKFDGQTSQCPSTTLCYVRPERASAERPRVVAGYEEDKGVWRNDRLWARGRGADLNSRTTLQSDVAIMPEPGGNSIMKVAVANMPRFELYLPAGAHLTRTPS